MIDARRLRRLDPIDEGRDHHDLGGGGPAPAIVQPTQGFGGSERQAHFLEDLPLCGRAPVRVSRVDPSAGKGHVARPRIQRMLGALDEKQLGPLFRIGQHHGHRGAAPVLRGHHHRVMGREGATHRDQVGHGGEHSLDTGCYPGPSMPPTPPATPTHSWISLARSDTRAASKRFADLAPDEQVALVCQAKPSERALLIGLADAPEALIAALPPAELCFTLKAIGLADAAWMLEHTSAEQLVAAVDLDAWSGSELDTTAVGEWLAALSRVSDEAKLRALHSLDAELLTLALRARIHVVQKPDDAEGWTPPDGAQTLEGRFYFVARADRDDLEDVVTLLRTFFEGAYWDYFRLMLAVAWELDAETEEWALRWRTGRLQDLGFPPWEDAVQVYRYLEPARRDALPEGAPPLDVEPWSLPVWMPQLPELAGAGARLFRAIGELPDPMRRACFYAFVALANRVAVADRLPLGDVDSTPAAIEKAARVASLGLAHLAERHDLNDAALLERAPLEYLFRLGANLDPERSGPPRSSGEDEAGDSD